MITIYPIKEYKGGFVVEGHANYAEHGQDIVCASVSVVTQMIAKELNERGYAWVTKSNGVLTVKIDEWAQPEIEELITMMLKTLREIEEQYPHYVILEEHNYE